jgi:myo-inositol-1(or 4)-monophosphatase
MTHHIDITYGRDLLTQVGVQLLDITKRKDYARNWEDMSQRFLQVNAWVVEQIKPALAQKYPDIRWLDDELELEKLRSAECEGDYWICDPVDGAINFMQGLPGWATSLCLVHNGRPQCSLVYDPCQKEFFWAVAGEGTFLNGEQVHVSQKQSMEDTIVSTSQPSNVTQDIEDTQRTTRAISQIMPRVFALRAPGGVALQLAYVACGRFDGFWEYGSDMYDWLAGSLLVREANGTVTDIQGNDFTWGASGIIAANPVIHQGLKTEVARSHANKV